RRRALHHLTGGDFIGDIIRENVNASHKRLMNRTLVSVAASGKKEKGAARNSCACLSCESCQEARRYVAGVNSLQTGQIELHDRCPIYPAGVAMLVIEVKSTSDPSGHEIRSEL